MGLLYGKRVLLGVTGSIAAYKAALLVRDFVKEGAEVQVICTPSALDFVTPLTLGTLSHNPVLSELIKDAAHGQWNNHVALGLWADLMVIAPASANTLAKMSSGEADNLLLTTYLSAKCPVYFAPAMDLDMHAHPANQDNISMLVNRGNIEIPSETGELASGLSGKGRMAEPENIVRFINNHLQANAALFGKRVLITAGPTQEPIDPVRYVGNRSSGKMGYAIAEAAVELGAEVILVSGPTSIKAPDGLTLINVVTAQEMFDACAAHFPDVDMAIMSAAVADYTPLNKASEKIKKKDENLQIELRKTKDILQYLGSIKKEGQLLVGFALETENELENAKGKLVRKNCDLIVLNSLRNEQSGFGFDTNQVTLVASNKVVELELMSKRSVADQIFNYLLEKL
jgi:phosphopantothenoylcysteine decarboxylase/phosphopantothenate--cysteine ligase